MSLEQVAGPSCRYLAPLYYRRTISSCQDFDRMQYLGVEPMLRHALAQL
jgi:hypothetical protein